MKIHVLVPVKVCSSPIKWPKKLPKFSKVYFGFVFKLNENYYFLNLNSLYGVRMTEEVNKLRNSNWERPVKAIMNNTTLALSNWNFGDESIQILQKICLQEKPCC